MKAPYEILIRNGIAGHVIANFGEDPRPITPAMWPSIGATINAESIQRATELESLLNAETAKCAALQAQLDAIPTADKIAQQKAEALAQAEALEKQAAELRALHPEGAE